MFSAPNYLGRRHGQNSLADLNPELVVGLRGLKQKVWFVDSNAAVSNGNGTSWDSAVRTLQAAHDLAGVDDIILVAPLHSETVIAAGGITLSRAGLSIIGLGNGNRRPQFNFTTAVTASVVITGAGTSIGNVRFTGGIDALTNPVHIQAADVTLSNIVTQDVTGQATDFIVTTAAADRLCISGWIHRGATAAGADTALSIVGGDGIVVEDFEIYGNFAVAAIENVTTACTNLRIGGGPGVNFIQNSLDNAAVVAVTLVSTSTGFVGPNINTRIGVDSTSNAANITEAFVGAAMQFMQPINIANLGGESSMQTNITASTDA